MRVMLTVVCTQVLSMQCNKIEAVKASIGYCRQLRAVYLKSNPLKKLALSIGALKELSILSYDNAETMAIPPYEVCFVLFCHKAARLGRSGVAHLIYGIGPIDIRSRDHVLLLCI